MSAGKVGFPSQVKSAPKEFQTKMVLESLYEEKWSI